MVQSPPKIRLINNISKEKMKSVCASMIDKSRLCIFEFFKVKTVMINSHFVG